MSERGKVEERKAVRKPVGRRGIINPSIRVVRGKIGNHQPISNSCCSPPFSTSPA